MNHDDFNRDPVESDEFFGELANTIDLVDALTRERLSEGELDRRREDIMNRVRRRKAATPAPDTTTDTAPAPCPDTAALGTGQILLDGLIRIGFWEQKRQSTALPLPRMVTATDTFAPSGLLSAAARAAALADAERYRDSALQKAAAIVRKAHQEADDLRAEAQRILDQARQEAAETAAVVRAQADLGTGPTGPFLSYDELSGPSAIPPSGNSPQPAATAGRGHKLQQALADLRAVSWVASGRPRPRTVIVVSTLNDVRSVAWLLSHDAGRDFVDIEGSSDPLLLAHRKYNRTSTAWPRLSGLRQHLEHHWPEHIQRAGSRERAFWLVLAAMNNDRGPVADVVRRPRAAQVDEWVLSRLWSQQCPSGVAATSYDVAVRYLSELSAVLHSDDPISGATASLPVLSPVRRLLLACDVEGFTRADTSLRTRWQHTVRQIIGEAVAEAGLESSRWLRQAKGDGELAILPVGTSPQTVFDQLLTAMDRQLREHNRYSTDIARLRLRVAVHEGVVASGVTHGFTGQAANTVNGLVNAPSLRRALAESPSASMAVAVSDPVYQDVAHDRSTAGQEPCIQVTVPQAKGTPETAWVFVPGESLHLRSWNGATAGVDTAGGRRPARIPQPPGQLTGPPGIFVG